jgi:hypothetical protein
VHVIAGALGLTLVTLFFTASVIVEVAGDDSAIADVKRWILYGVAILIPSMVITGASGRSLIARRRGPLVRVKQRRMIAIAVIGLIVLTPCAVFLQRLSAGGEFGPTFMVVQLVELVGGAVNITLMGLNVRAGLLLTGRIRRQRPSRAAPSRLTLARVVEQPVHSHVSKSEPI